MPGEETHSRVASIFLIEESTEMLPSTSTAADPQQTGAKHVKEVWNSVLRRKLEVLYFVFKICDPPALESMSLLFEQIKKAIWANEELCPLVHRSKFNAGFKNMNLWAANLGAPEAERLKNTFERFSNDLARTLDSVRIEFADIFCDPHRGRIAVSLKPDSEGQRVLRRLQSELILRFGEFQEPGYVKLYEPNCRLLSLDTRITFERVEAVVRQCFSGFGRFAARLRPFIVCHDLEVLFQHPKSLSVHSETENETPEWVSRSLCVFNIPPNRGMDPSKIIASLAVLIGFKLEDHMIETCDPKTEYYTSGHTSRIVAVFRTTPLRESFYKSFKSCMIIKNWRILASDVIEGFPEHHVFVVRALPAMEDQLWGTACDACRESLPDYKAGVDAITLAHYLEQRFEPRRQYYFKTREELHDLIILLKKGTGTEYLSSVW